MVSEEKAHFCVETHSRLGISEERDAEVKHRGQLPGELPEAKAGAEEFCGRKAPSDNSER